MAESNRDLLEMEKSIESIESKAIVSRLTADEKENRAALLAKVDQLRSNFAKDILQKARINWAKFGDENSSYFHRVVAINASRNKINGLLFQDSYISNPVSLKVEIMKWFKK